MAGVYISPSLVHVYDSLYNTVHDDTVMQVAAIMHTAEHYVDFKVHKIQFQSAWYFRLWTIFHCLQI